MSRPSRWGLPLLASAAFITLAACGGGGGGGSAGAAPSPPPPSPPPPSGTTYQPGVYPASSQFEAQCQNPRSGVDIEGNSFPDEQGTLLEELFWLRSWTNETYLWNDEVTDRDPNNYNDRLVYFDLLKTNATTPSGAPKDQFHFSEPTEDYLAARNSAPQPGYGASFAIIRGTPPRDVRVRYVEPGSPAAEMDAGRQKMIRSNKILEVDGIDVVNANSQQAVDQLNAAFFPETVGETHTFVVDNPNFNGGTFTVSLTSANVVRQPINHTSVLDLQVDATTTIRTGYIVFNTFSPFSSEQQIVDAMRQMQDAGVEELVLDLRYNGGGLLAVASQLAYMIAGPNRSSGKTFERLRFNDDAGNVNPVTGETNNQIPFYTTGLGFSVANGASLPTLDLDRVFIITSPNTCSASESVINGLRGIDVDVQVFGSGTCGKPYGFYPTDNCGETYYTIQFQGVNDKGFGDYADGFTPQNAPAGPGVRIDGCYVIDDLNRPFGELSESILSDVSSYIATPSPSCPAYNGQAASSSIEKAPASAKSEPDGPAITRPEEPVFERNRDLSMPGDYRGRSN